MVFDSSNGTDTLLGDMVLVRGSATFVSSSRLAAAGRLAVAASRWPFAAFSGPAVTF
jgi:hypothetical protein